MRAIVCLLMLGVCTATYSQNVVGEHPDVLPEFMPETVCDTVIVDEGIRYEGQ